MKCLVVGWRTVAVLCVKLQVMDWIYFYAANILNFLIKLKLFVQIILIAFQYRSASGGLFAGDSKDL